MKHSTITLRILTAAIVIYGAGQIFSGHSPMAVRFTNDATTLACVLAVIAIAGTTTEARYRRRREAEDRLLVAAGKALAHPGQIKASFTWDGRRGKKITAMSIRYPPSVNDHDPALQTNVEKMIAGKLGAPIIAKWRPADDRVDLRRKAQIARLIPHPVGVLKGDMRIPFATAENNQTLSWDPTAKASHCLVIGETGMGKTECLMGMGIEGANRGYQVYIVDPKRISLHAIEDWPGVIEFSDTVTKMMATIATVHNEMEDRYTAIRNKTIKASRLAKILLVIEEYTELDSIMAALPRKAGEETLAQVRSILRLGRGAGIHVLIGMQRPDAKILTGEARANIGYKIGMGYLDTDAARMIGAKAPITSDAPGRALVVHRGRQTECQVWHTPDLAEDLTAEEIAIVERLRPSGTRRRAQLMAPAEPVFEPIDRPIERAGREATNTPSDTGSNTADSGPVDQKLIHLEPGQVKEKLSDQEIATIVSMRANNGSVRVIAQALGRAPSTIHKYVRQAEQDKVVAAAQRILDGES